MERAVTLSAPDSPVHGYSRAAVEEFVSAAAAEETKLEAVIEEAATRTRKARAAIGTHRVMVAMILEAQHQLDDIRAQAESEAARILAQGERDADELAPLVSPPELDLVGAETMRPEPPPVADARPQEPPEGSDYFAFLRGALVDDEPLGPRGE
jgi:hypothetical protein